MSRPKRIFKPERFPLLSKKSNQFIDKIIMVSKPEFPETATINEGYISLIKWDIIHTVYNKEYKYIEMEIVIKSDFSWKSILVMMTFEELNQVFNKSYDKRFLKLSKSILEHSPLSFRYIFDSYFHCKGIDLSVLQNTYTEMANGINNEYFTLDFLKYAS